MKKTTTKTSEKKTAVSATEPSWMKGRRPALLLTLAALAVYLPSLWYQFSPMDERWVIFNHKDTLSSFSNVPQLFRESMMGMYYRPMITFSFMIDMVIGDGAAFWFHLSNILLHVGCTLLLFRFLKRLSVAETPAFLFALIFAVHPINVHTVAWIPGRNDSLLCLFALASTNLLIDYFRTSKISALAFHLLFFLLALFSKENAIVLPVVYLLLYVLLFRENKNFRTTLPLAGAWMITGAAWFFLRKHFVNFLPPMTGHSFGDNVLKFFTALLSYTGKIFLPVQQSVMPVLHDMSVLPFLIVTIVVIIIIFRFGLKDKKIALFGFAWFYLFLVIPAWAGATAINGDQYEHRVYTSLAGALLFLSQVKISLRPELVRRLALALAVVFAVKTMIRSSVYQDEFSFTLAGTEESPSVAFLHDMLGYLYDERKEYDAAIDSYSKAIALNNTRPEFYNNRGKAYYEKKDLAHALEDDNKVLSMRKDEPQTYVNRSMVYYSMGNFRQAFLDVKEAQKLNASIPPAYIRDLNVQLQGENIKQCNTILEKDSTNAGCYNLRGTAWLRVGQLQKALDDFNHAVKYEPGNAQFLQNRDSALAILQRVAPRN